MFITKDAFGKSCRRRRSSLPDDSTDLEITRQFVIKKKKVINKGDTLKIRDSFMQDACANSNVFSGETCIT